MFLTGFWISRFVARRFPSRAAALAATLALVGSALAAAPASARSITLHGGTFTIAFTAKAYGQFTYSSTGYGGTSGNSVATVGPAAANSASFTFPVASGKLDSRTYNGSVSARRAAGLDFVDQNPNITSGGVEFWLTSLALHLGKQSTLTVTFKKRGGKRTTNLAVATLVTTREKHSRQGQSVSMTKLTLKLTAKGVQVFKLMGGTWKLGQTLGSVTVAATS